MKKYYLIIFIAGAILTLAGCAHFSSAPARGDEASLRQRVNMEWQAKINHNWTALYDLTTTEHKKSVDRSAFKYKSNVILSGFSIKKLELLEEGTKALVQVDLKIKQMGFEFIFPSREEWLWEQGTWCLNIKPGSSPKLPLPVQQ